MTTAPSVPFAGVHFITTAVRSAPGADPDADYVHYPHEVAARITLVPAARALQRPGGGLDDGESVAVTTACAALATRVGLLDVLARPAGSPAWDPVPLRFGQELPDRMLGAGSPPDRALLVAAGARCVGAWRRWSDPDADAADDRRGVAGALALAAWCSWATAQPAQARGRAEWALDVARTDPVAELVLRWCARRVAPAWRAV